MPVPVVITAYGDRTFTFITKTPPNSYFLKQAARIEKGATATGKGATVGARDHEPAARDRRPEDEGHERQRRRGRRAHAHRHAPARWASPWWRAEPWHEGKRLKAALQERRPQQVLPARPRRSALIKANAKAKFDETVEMAMNLGIDPRHADQMVRGLISLPNGTGKTLRVGVFARGPKAEEAQAAGADVVGAEDLAEKVQAGEIDFDRCIATPDMMGAGRPAGQNPRPARPDAEPAPRHRHHGREGRDPGRQGRPGRVPGREGGHRACRHRQGESSRPSSCWRTPRPSPTPSSRRSRPAPKAPISQRAALSSTMGPGVRRGRDQPRRLRSASIRRPGRGPAGRGREPPNLSETARIPRRRI